MATKRKSSDVLEILRGDLGLLSNSNLTNGGSNKIVNDNFEGVKVDGGGWKVCKCEVEKQDKAVQVSDTDLKDEELGRMETTNGQLHGVDNTGFGKYVVVVCRRCIGGRYDCLVVTSG